MYTSKIQELKCSRCGGEFWTLTGCGWNHPHEPPLCSLECLDEYETEKFEKYLQRCNEVDAEIKRDRPKARYEGA